jgi:hypothetical protein
MSQGRIPAQIVVNLGRESHNLSSSGNIADADIMHQTGGCQQPLTGNRCGHDIYIPTLANIPTKHKRRFPVLETAKENMLYAYTKPMRYMIGQLFFNPEKKNKDGSYRQLRSEIREAITCKVGQVILHYVNLANMALGFILPNGAFSPYGVEFIAKIANANLSQVRRALEHFKSFGYIKIVERKYKTVDGLTRSDTPIITVSPQLFIDLEIPESELIKHQAKQEGEYKKAASAWKASEYNKSQREQKKAMKEIKKKLNLAKTIEKMKKGKYLTDAEKELLSEEMPGYNRKSFDRHNEPNQFTHFLKKITDPDTT